MKQEDDRSFLSPLRNKVIAAFLLALVAIFLAASTTYFSFNNLLIQVDELSAPNEKLKTINHLFESITKLDQQQRAAAIQNPFLPSHKLLRESREVMGTIDSLLQYTWNGSQQRQRIQSMKQLLTKREYYLIEYMKLRSLIYSKQNQKKIDSVTAALMSAMPLSDSSVTTTQQKKVTTTYLEEPVKKPNFFSRLFGGKKKETIVPKAEVKEEVIVTTDTLAFHRSDSAVQGLSRLMKLVQQTSQLQNKKLLQRELALANTSMALTNHVLSILQEVENEEILAVEQNNADAVALVKSSSHNIGIIITVFFLIAAILIFLILVDISKSNYYRLQLINAKTEAEHLAMVKQRFLSNMSHEIRSPLQSIIGYSEQLIEQKYDPSSVRAIQSSSRHLLQIANEVLDYSRIDSNTFSIESIPFHLTEVLSEIAASTQVLVDQKGIDFEMQKESLPDCLLIGDPFRLKQILYNLLSNAVKFTAKGRVVLKVETRIDLLVTCTFSVIDTGIGLDNSEIDRVFGEFEQANARIHEEFGGSGLGLTIVRRLVTLLKGEISVVSELGRGSTFSVELKFEKTWAREARSAKSEIKEIRPKKIKVVLIDDDELILNLCGIILKKREIPFVAISQPQFWSEYDFEDAVIAFIDIRMPQINGAELAQKIRKEYPIIRLIAFTAHALPEEQKGLLANGFDQLLLKPFLESEFIEIVYGQSDSSEVPPVMAPILNLHGLRKLVDFDDALFLSIINDFCEESKDDLVNIHSAILTGDPAQVREFIHKLVSRTGQIGLGELSNKLHSIEKRLAQNASLISMKEDMEEVQRMIRESVSQLEFEYLNKAC
jgi:signal transduction histidine kinase/CheY-like chemotaxis protein